MKQLGNGNDVRPARREPRFPQLQRTPYEL